MIHLYSLESIMGYDPSKGVEQIKTRMLAINIAGAAVNLPERGSVEPAINRIRMLAS
jgi:hypothetical protein